MTDPSQNPSSSPEQPPTGAPVPPPAYTGQPAYGQQPPAYGAQPGYGQQPGYPAPGAAYGYGDPVAALDGAQDPSDLTRPLYGATFGQAIKRFFKKYASFSGRASRSEFWWVALFIALLELIPAILLSVGGAGVAAAAVTQATYQSYGYTTGLQPDTGSIAALAFGLLLLVLISLATIVPWLALNWRRLHDANLAGPFWFLSFVGGIGGLVVLILTILPSKPEGRRFDQR